MRVANRAERLKDSRVDIRVVEFVVMIVVQEELEARVYKRCIRGFTKLCHRKITGRDNPVLAEPIACMIQGPPDQGRGAIPDVAGYYILGQWLAMKMFQHGVDRSSQVGPRIDQGSIQIEYQQLQRFFRDGPRSMNHS